MKKANLNNKKLDLKPETLVSLQRSQLDGAVGGAAGPVTDWITDRLKDVSRYLTCP
jgi:hypothetical protein